MLRTKKLEHLRIPLQDIKSATNNFDEEYKIGIGGFGKVYKAFLLHFDVQKFKRDGEIPEPSKKTSTVAVKRLDATSLQGQQEFLTEIAMLSDYWHSNLITLLGFCDQEGEMILVYELAINGSLDGYFCKNGRKLISLTWAQRLRICLGAACGLEYLHEGLGNNHRIIHCDIKSSNILLDHNFVAKISDFGLSKVGFANQQVTFVPCYATRPYLDPKFLETNVLTKKSDVYSFGVVLFEVLSGCLSFEAKNDEKLFLGQLAKLRYEQGRLGEIYDPDLKKAIGESSSILKNGIDLDSINVFAKIAYQCLLENPEDRPTMADVVRELEEALKCQVKGVEVLRLSLEEIKSATNNFDSKNLIESKSEINDCYRKRISVCRIGRVYRGELSCFNVKGSRTVAIKRFDVDSRCWRNNYLFITEVAMLFNHNHKNIIPLLGFCDEEGEQILVYRFAPYGSLDKHLHNRCSLTWMQRLNICLDVAHGLQYLHEGVEPQYRAAHGNVKSSNILLSDNWEASICDFGESKVVNKVLIFGSDFRVDSSKSKLFYTTVEATPYIDSKDNHFAIMGLRTAAKAISSKLISKRLVDMEILPSRNMSIDHEVKPLDIDPFLTFSKVAYVCKKESQRQRIKVLKRFEKSSWYKTGSLSGKSDIYSFGVVLFEILFGRLAFVDRVDEQHFLTPLARNRFEDKRLDEIVDSDSMHTLLKIAYECTEAQREERPTIDQVVKQLEKALEFQENYEWGKKLPRDYEEIIKMSKSPVVCSTKKVLYELVSKGFLLDNGKWFSLSKEGVSCEMVPATMFSYQDPKKSKWRAIRKSRFPKVAKMLDLSNLMFEARMQTQFLSPGITYAAYLVFRFCDQKKIKNAPIYVELKYRLGKQRNSSISYFAEWRDNGWMAIDLCHFTIQETRADFEVLLERFSRCYCGSGSIYVEGIEFLPVENVGHEEAEKLKDEHNVQSLFNSGLDMDQGQKLPTNYQSVIKRRKDDLSCTKNQELFSLSAGILMHNREKVEHEEAEKLEDVNNVRSHLKSGLDIDWEQKLPTNYQSTIKKAKDDLSYTNNQELFFLLSAGILVSKGEKLLYLSIRDGKKCHMLPARIVVCDSSNIKPFKRRPLSESRFQEAVEILRYHEFRLKSNIETRLLSPNTVYACYLVYKLREKCRGLQYPVKARNLLPGKRKETVSIYLRSPSLVNRLRSTRLPVKRQDGWMEVVIWEFNSEMANNKENLPMHMKLISLGGNMSGLVLEGLEFRPQ